MLGLQEIIPISIFELKVWLIIECVLMEKALDIYITLHIILYLLPTDR